MLKSTVLININPKKEKIYNEQQKPKSCIKKNIDTKNVQYNAKILIKEGAQYFLSFKR